MDYHKITCREGDPELTYSTSDVDRRMRSIVGEENFVHWDERYGG